AQSPLDGAANDWPTASSPPEWRRMIARIMLTGASCVQMWGWLGVEPGSVTRTTAPSSSIWRFRDGGVQKDSHGSAAITASDPDTAQTPAAGHPRAGSPCHENVSVPDGFRVGVSANATPGATNKAINTPIPNRAKADPFTARDRDWRA